MARGSLTGKFKSKVQIPKRFRKNRDGSDARRFFDRAAGRKRNEEK